MPLDGKVALVTGAAKRLGYAIALALAKAGADLVLHVHTSSGEEIVREVSDLGRRALLVRADLSRVAEAERTAREAFALAGHVDVLVNNAAVFFPSPLSTVSVESWRTVLGVNLTAPFALSLVLGRTMRARGRGKIVQLSDWRGQRPVPSYLPYCVAKGGVHALTQVLAKALAPQVQVNEIVLGPVLPPAHYDVALLHTIARQTPLGRLGSAAEVARAVRFLVEASEVVTGASYVVDGGWLAVPSGRATSV